MYIYIYIYIYTYIHIFSNQSKVLIQSHTGSEFTPNPIYMPRTAARAADSAAEFSSAIAAAASTPAAVARDAWRDTRALSPRLPVPPSILSTARPNTVRNTLSAKW